MRLSTFYLVEYRQLASQSLCIVDTHVSQYRKGYFGKVTKVKGRYKRFKRRGCTKMQMSVSAKKSSTQTNIKHNNRDLNDKEKIKNQHIDYTKTKDNIYLIQSDLKELYKEEFDAPLEKYNAKQKRADRKIKNYYDHVKSSKKTHLQQEMIFQIGDKDDFTSEENRKLANEVLQNWYEGFQQRNPKLKVYNAVIHNDEASPHLHLNFVPVADGYKRGLEKQVSFDKAVLQQNPNFDKRRPFHDWRNSEVAILESLLKEKGIERKVVGTNDYKDVNDYKIKKDLEREIETKRQELEIVKTHVEELKDENNKLDATIQTKKQENKRMIDLYKSNKQTIEDNLKSAKLKKEVELKQVITDLVEQHNDELQAHQLKFETKKKQIEDDTNAEVEKLKAKILDGNTELDLVNQHLESLKMHYEDTLENFKSELAIEKERMKQEHEKDLENYETELAVEREQMKREHEKELKSLNKELNKERDNQLEQYKIALSEDINKVDNELIELKEKQTELLTENEKIERTNKQLKNISEYDFAKLGLNQATLDYFEGLNARMEHLEGSVVTDEDNQVKLSVDDFKELISVSKTSTENFKGAFKRTLDYREVNQSKNLIKSLYDNALSTVDELKTRNDKLMRFPKFIEEEGLVPRYNAWVRDKKKQKEVQPEKDDGLDL